MNAIIIDDEKTGARGLKLLIEQHCRDITIVAVEDDPGQGINSILELKPDVVFLDIEMPGATGFDVINATSTVDYEVIFTTAYEHYAIKAFKAQAVDYLLKPIDVEELTRAVSNVRARLQDSGRNVSNRLDELLRTVSLPVKKISIPTSRGIMLVAPAEIIYLESDSNYTTVYLKDGNRHLVSKTLKSFEERLSPDDFCRVHSAYLVNLNEVEQYVRGDGGTLILANKTSIPVSRTHKQSLMNRIGF